MDINTWKTLKTCSLQHYTDTIPSLLPKEIGHQGSEAKGTVLTGADQSDVKLLTWNPNYDYYDRTFCCFVVVEFLFTFLSFVSLSFVTDEKARNGTRVHPTQGENPGGQTHFTEYSVGPQMDFLESEHYHLFHQIIAYEKEPNKAPHLQALAVSCKQSRVQ